MSSDGLPNVGKVNFKWSLFPAGIGGHSGTISSGDGGAVSMALGGDYTPFLWLSAISFSGRLTSSMFV